MKLQDYEIAVGEASATSPTNKGFIFTISNASFIVYPEDKDKGKDFYRTDTSSQRILAVEQSEVPLTSLLEVKASAKYIVKGRYPTLNHNLQNIHETTDFELRFLGLDLNYYKQRIPPEQLRLLMEIVGIYPAPGNFNPEEIFYPEDL